MNDRNFDEVQEGPENTQWTADNFVGHHTVSSYIQTLQHMFQVYRMLQCNIMMEISSSSSISTTTLRWVSACSTVAEHSQQEGFTGCRCQRHVQPATWSRTRDLERSNFCHKRPPASEVTLANPAAEGGTMGEKWLRIFPKVATSTSLLGFFYMP
jgi:hypothetical protein